MELLALLKALQLFALVPNLGKLLFVRSVTFQSPVPPSSPLSSCSIVLA